MPFYSFELREGFLRIEDEVGVSFPDREQAFAYARDVVRELMEGCERQTRTWRLDVYEDGAERVLEIRFATVDRTLDHLPRDLRANFELLCDRVRLLQEAMSAASVTMRESKALVALSRGKPYLATLGGQATICDASSADGQM